MFKHLKRTVILAAAALSLAVPLYAQSRSAVGGAELDAAVTLPAAGHRESVREFLTTPQAEQAAARMGITAEELSARVALLDDATVTRLAERARLGDVVLAGGANTIVISTTAIIIGLLILILLVD